MIKKKILLLIISKKSKSKNKTIKIIVCKNILKPHFLIYEREIRIEKINVINLL